MPCLRVAALTHPAHAPLSSQAAAGRLRPLRISTSADASGFAAEARHACGAATR
jgi:hypothetical protein